MAEGDNTTYFSMKCASMWVFGNVSPVGLVFNPVSLLDTIQFQHNLGLCDRLIMIS